MFGTKMCQLFLDNKIRCSLTDMGASSFDFHRLIFVYLYRCEMVHVSWGKYIQMPWLCVPGEVSPIVFLWPLCPMDNVSLRQSVPDRCVPALDRIIRGLDNHKSYSQKYGPLGCPFNALLFVESYSSWLSLHFLLLLCFSTTFMKPTRVQYVHIIGL